MKLLPRIKQVSCNITAYIAHSGNARIIFPRSSAVLWQHMHHLIHQLQGTQHTQVTSMLPAIIVQKNRTVNLFHKAHDELSVHNFVWPSITGRQKPHNSRSARGCTCVQCIRPWQTNKSNGFQAVRWEEHTKTKTAVTNQVAFMAQAHTDTHTHKTNSIRACSFYIKQ